MNKEEILATSRRENKDRDLYQQENDYKAMNCALTVIIIFITLLLLLHFFAGNGFRVELYAPVGIYNAILYTYRYVKANEKKKSDLVVLLCWCFVSVISVIASIASVYIV